MSKRLAQIVPKGAPQWIAVRIAIGVLRQPGGSRLSAFRIERRRFLGTLDSDHDEIPFFVDRIHRGQNGS